MKSEVTSVASYLAGLPADRRMVIENLRNLILKNLPNGYEEAVNWGMITYEVPLATEPKTNNGKPLMYAALASQKNYMAVYICSLSCVEGANEKFVASWSGKKLDKGQSCIRFKKLEDIDQASIGRSIAETSVVEFISAFKTKFMKK
jgi:Domain of unknown function (DU1801)